MLRRSTLNVLVDVVTLLAIFVMVATGLVIRFVLPPGTGGGHGEGGLALWGYGRHDWGDVHFWTSVVLAVLLVVHVALHWSWVCVTTHRMLGGTETAQPAARRCNACGIGFLAAVVLVFAGFTWYADTAVTPFGAQRPSASGPAPAADVPRHGDEAGHDQVRGSMSLAEVEAATGVSVEALKTELGLPGQTTGEQRLGRLARQYGFSVDRVREIVANHASKPAQ